jgi:hypothetical protein
VASQNGVTLATVWLCAYRWTGAAVPWELRSCSTVASLSVGPFIARLTLASVAPACGSYVHSPADGGQPGVRLSKPKQPTTTTTAQRLRRPDRRCARPRTAIATSHDRADSTSAIAVPHHVLNRHDSPLKSGKIGLQTRKLPRTKKPGSVYGTPGMTSKGLTPMPSNRITCTCQGCGREFTVKPSQFARGAGKCCSMECRRTRLMAVCPVCGKEFVAWPSVIQRRKYCSRECSAAGRSLQVERVCRHCGGTFMVKQCLVNKGWGLYCSQSCAAKSRTGTRNPLFKGYTSKNDKGYIVVREPGKPSRLQHRVIMEQHLGRPLRYEEIVHHINGDKADNRIENLVIVSPYEHHKLHRKKNP